MRLLGGKRTSGMEASCSALTSHSPTSLSPTPHSPTPPSPLVQGPMVILEYYAAKWLARRGIKPNPWLGRALTVPFLMVVGHYFFFAPVTYDTDTADRFLQASLVKVKWALSALDGLELKLPAGLLRLLPAAAQKTSG
jgi:hypothetical protein